MNKTQNKDAPTLLVVISGPSGVGKDAVVERMKRLPRPWRFIVTATTRLKRPMERDGVDYLFMTPPQFAALLAQDGFLEHATVYGHSYGVPRVQVEQALASGKDAIVKTDVQGAATIRKQAPGALLIFLVPPHMAELERRLRERKSETAEEVERRIRTAAEEMARQPEFDYVVVNHTGRLEQTVEEIEGIIAKEKERQRVPSPLMGEGEDRGEAHSKRSSSPSDLAR
ncbi:MAG: guanylate kinase [Chloroflexi bacterium]|nr:guanylate kinase [Chloroflexota bacterium]